MSQMCIIGNVGSGSRGYQYTILPFFPRFITIESIEFKGKTGCEYIQLSILEQPFIVNADNRKRHVSNSIGIICKCRTLTSDRKYSVPIQWEIFKNTTSDIRTRRYCDSTKPKNVKIILKFHAD